MRLFILSFALLTLAACEPGQPTYAPAGYTYHGETYHAPPGPALPAKQVNAEGNPVMRGTLRAAPADTRGDINP